MAPANQNPEQQARDRIDILLRDAGWVVQSKNQFDLGAGLGVAIREYQTDAGPADYVLFVDRQPVGVIEAKREQAQHDHQLPPNEEPTESQMAAAQQMLLREASSLFTGPVMTYIENVRKVHEQVIDTVNLEIGRAHV